MADHDQILASVNTENLLAVFVDHRGQPLAFYIDPAEPDRMEYAKRIHEYGGIVEMDASAAAQPGVIQLSRYGRPDMETVLLQFVDECLKKGRPLYMDDFRIPADHKKRHYETMDAVNAIINKKHKQDDKHKGTKSTVKFTPEADMYIMEQVRMKPRYRTLHKFFEELSQHDMLKGHTGNSVRSRYRAHLEHKLNYVYKTDAFDNMILDANGERIGIPINQARTIKTKFTAEDDFHLCDDVINHVIRNQDPEHLRKPVPEHQDPDHLHGEPQYPLDESKFSVLISFFDEYARQNPLHSLLSWRDRYRKFAKNYGLQKYREDYLKASSTKEGPKPMSKMTKRKGKVKLDDDKDEVVAVATAVISRNMPYDAMLQPQHHLLMVSRASALDEEIGEVKNSNIHEALRNVGAQAGRVNIEDDMVIHPNLTGDHDAEANAFSEMALEQESQDPTKEMNYLSKQATLEDVFNDHFFHHKPKEILANMLEFLSKLRPEEIDKVSDTLESYGFTGKFVGHILRVTGAHAMYINEYLNHVFRLIELGKSTDLAEVLFVVKDGFWTPEADEALIKQDYAALSYMSEGNIKQRRTFLGLD